jgi:prevent-host-death family protein
MTTIVNVYEAKAQLSRLLEQVERGEEVVVARAGRPVARLVPYRRNRGPRRLGLAAGKVTIHPGFDEYDEEIIAMFEGSEGEEDP